MSALVEDLEPVARSLCRQFLASVEELMLPPIRVTHTRREFDEQLHLYAKGRKLESGIWVVVDKRAIVTKAKPGESAHNFGAAFDICVVGPDPYPNDAALWEAYGTAGERLGLAWGGRWKGIVDRPHFERPDWKTLRN